MGLLDEIFGGGTPFAPQLDPRAVQAATQQPRPAPAQRPDFGGGIDGQQVLGAILKGMGGIAAPVGDLVMQSSANERQTQLKNDTYDWLLKQKDPQTGQPITPDVAKLIVTNKDVASQVLPRLLGSKTTTEATTKGAPSGYMWSDPQDPAKGVQVIPGYQQKSDPIDRIERQTDAILKRQQDKEDLKRIEEARKDGSAGRDTIDKIRQLRQAREGVSYEGGYLADARTWLGKNIMDGPSWLGIPGVPSQEEAGKAEQVQSLATDIQLQFTSKTKGAISDREMSLFGQATPGMAMSDNGAENVMNGFEAGGLRAREKPKFYEAYRKANGSLDGADDAWDSFVESKPILEGDGKGGFTVNRDNVGAWRDFVGGNASQSATPPASGGGSVLDKAKAAIAAGADRNAVIERLRQNGIDPAGL